MRTWADQFGDQQTQIMRPRHNPIRFDVVVVDNNCDSDNDDVFVKIVWHGVGTSRWYFCLRYSWSGSQLALVKMVFFSIHNRIQITYDVLRHRNPNSRMDWQQCNWPTDCDAKAKFDCVNTTPIPGSKLFLYFLCWKISFPILMTQSIVGAVCVCVCARAHGEFFSFVDFSQLLRTEFLQQLLNDFKRYYRNYGVVCWTSTSTI